VSMDMGPPFDKSARRPGHATKAVICYDRSTWCSSLRSPRQGPPPGLGRTCVNCPTRRRLAGSGGRCALLKNPTDLTDDQTVTLRKLKRRGVISDVPTRSTRLFGQALPATSTRTRSP